MDAYFNPTKLFGLIERGDDAASIVRVMNHPEEAGTWIVASSQFSADGLVGGVVGGGAALPSTIVRWRYLPLHLACLQDWSSPELIRALLDAYPPAARRRDGAGNLPAHCLCMGTCEDWSVLEALLDAYPPGMEKESGDGRLLTQIIQDRGNSDEGSLATNGTMIAKVSGFIQRERNNQRDGRPDEDWRWARSGKDRTTEQRDQPPPSPLTPTTPTPRQLRQRQRRMGDRGRKKNPSPRPHRRSEYFWLTDTEGEEENSPPQRGRKGGRDGGGRGRHHRSKSLSKGSHKGGNRRAKSGKDALRSKSTSKPRSLSRPSKSGGEEFVTKEDRHRKEAPRRKQQPTPKAPATFDKEKKWKQRILDLEDRLDGALTERDVLRDTSERLAIDLRRSESDAKEFRRKLDETQSRESGERNMLVSTLDRTSELERRLAEADGRGEDLLRTNEGLREESEMRVRALEAKEVLLHRTVEIVRDVLGGGGKEMPTPPGSGSPGRGQRLHPPSLTDCADADEGGALIRLRSELQRHRAAFEASERGHSARALSLETELSETRREVQMALDRTGMERDEAVRNAKSLHLMSGGLQDQIASTKTRCNGLEKKIAEVAAERDDLKAKLVAAARGRDAEIERKQARLHMEFAVLFDQLRQVAKDNPALAGLLNKGAGRKVTAGEAAPASPQNTGSPVGGLPVAPPSSPRGSCSDASTQTPQSTEGDIQSYRDRIEELDRENYDLKEGLQKAEAEVRTSTDELMRARNEAGERVRPVQGEVKTLEHELATLTEALAKTRQDADEQVQSAQEKVNVLEDELRTLTDVLARMRQEADEEVQLVREELKTLKAELETLTGALARTRQDANEEVRLIREEVKALEADLEQARANAEGFGEDGYQDLSDAREKLVEVVSDLKKKNQSLRETILKNNEAYITKVQDFDALRRENEALRGALEGLQVSGSRGDDSQAETSDYRDDVNVSDRGCVSASTVDGSGGGNMAAAGPDYSDLERRVGSVARFLVRISEMQNRIMAHVSRQEGDAVSRKEVSGIELGLEVETETEVTITEHDSKNGAVAMDVMPNAEFSLRPDPSALREMEAITAEAKERGTLLNSAVDIQRKELDSIAQELAMMHR